MKCRRKNSPHSLSSYKRRNKLQQVVLSLFKLYECFKKSKLLNSCALKYIDKLNFVAFRSVRLQQGKLQEKKKNQGREDIFQDGTKNQWSTFPFQNVSEKFGS